jgi:multidrug resistance efflux pump
MNRNFLTNHIRVGTPSQLGQQHSCCHSERSLRTEESLFSWVSAKFAIANILVAALLLALALSCASCGVSTVGASDGDVPSGAAQKGDVQLRFPTDGLLKATQSRAVAVPAVAGGTLRIIRLAHTGSSVKKGDTVLEFDPSQQEYLMAQNRSDLAQAEQEILKDKADAEVQTAEDGTALLKAKYAVRRAELDVSKNELLSEIDAKKNLLALEEARRALAQLQSDIQSHSTSSEAAMALSQEKHNKARLAMQQAEENIQNMKVKAAIDGMVVIHGNRNSTGGMFWGGMTLPEYHVGDQANPGEVVAEVIDISQMEISAQVSERDRPYIKQAQSVEIFMDALPNEKFSGKVTNVAGSAGNNDWFEDMQRKFDVTIHLDHSDPRLRPGFTSHLVILGDRLAQVLTIPSEAVFDHSGKSVAYIRKIASWQPQEIKVSAFTEGRAIVDSGLAPGTQVALVDPEKRAATKSKSPAASGPSVNSGGN